MADCGCPIFGHMSTCSASPSAKRYQSEIDELRAQLKAKDADLAHALRLMEEYRDLCKKAQEIAARAVFK